LETLFGGELPLAGKLLFFLLIVLGLFGAVIWVVRRFGGERLGGATGRGRQPRLALIEFAALGDGRRRLILIRRDNVEHLLMIGGPTDVVVEANIVRAAGAAREAPAPGAGRGPSVPEAAPIRQAPAPEPSPWPLQPEPAPRPQRIPAPPVAEEPDRWMEPEPPAVPPPPPRRQPRPAIAERPVDPLAGLAAELARATEPVRGPAGGDTDAGSFAPPSREARVPREPMRPRATPTRQPAPVTREPEPSSPEPEEVMPDAPRLREPQAPVAPPAEPALDASADQNLAEMAQRLEAALRRPARTSEPRPADNAPRSPESDNVQPTPVAIPATAPARAAGEAAPARGEPKPSKSLYDNLEKEMASLLGRPGGKS
jgi:flagellar protein FliO/FliZ